MMLLLYPGPDLMLAFATIGVAIGIIDVVINEAGNAIERASGRSSLQWAYAGYSAGAVVGALGSGVALEGGVPFRAILTIASLLPVLPALVAVGVKGLDVGGDETGFANRSLARSLFAPGFPLAAASIVLCAFLLEGTLEVWSVVYVRRTLDASALAGAFAVAAFSFAMAFGRVLAARFLFTVGHARTLLVSGLGTLLAGAGLVLTRSPLIATISLLALGLFLASASPAAFGMIDAGTPQATAAGVAAVTAVSYFGFIIGPPLAGWLAGALGFRSAMGILSLASVGILLGGILASRPGARGLRGFNAQF